MNSKAAEEGVVEALGHLQWSSGSPNEDPFAHALRAWMIHQRLLSQGQWIGHCRGPDGTPKVAIAAGSTTRVSE
eukprot:2009943-Alexandrium_andersonii.AAC.1